MRYIKVAIYCILFTTTHVFSQSIEEKLSSPAPSSTQQNNHFSEQLQLTNYELRNLKSQLKATYNEVDQLKKQGAEDGQFKDLLKKVNTIRSKIEATEKKFQVFISSQSKEEEEGYGLWDQEDTTLSQLVMEYGSSDFLYIIPPEIGSMKLHMHSNLPVPRESWSELLDVLLVQNGIGIKQVNSFTRQLYLLRQDLIAIEGVLSTPMQLALAEDQDRIAYIFSPALENLKSAFHFFDRFRDPKKTFLYTVGNKIAIVSLKEEVQKLLHLYDAVWEKDGEKVTKVVPLTRISADEILKLLKSFFGSLAEGNRFAMSKGGNELAAQPLKHENSLVLIGSKEIVVKAETLIKETQGQLEDPSEMTVYWYNCRHSDPNDLAEVLQKVYQSLIYCGVEGTGSKGNDTTPANNSNNEELLEGPKDIPSSPSFDNPRTVNPINPPLVQPGTISSQEKKINATNFIPSPKTGSLMMVVRKDTLSKIKELLKKLDTPKKMVQIEVLLCEKKLNHQTNSGLNILKLGSAASSEHKTGAIYDASSKSSIKGLFEFFISRKKHNHIIPAFDISYNFLLSQEDVRINASPSILTVNQTPATISIVEEISVNNGAAPIETNSNITFEKSFSREQFGITIVMTPTIHDYDPEDEESKSSISLETNITFDTPKSDKDDRPNVNRRHIQNNVRVVDGQTVVIGGLRKKLSEDNMEKIPFLGEIPGIAKLFGTSVMHDQSTEMFMFITPKIIHDSKVDLEKIMKEELMKRPGDIPEYIDRLINAKHKKKRRLFEQSFKLIFGNLD